MTASGRAALASLFLACCPFAYALNPSLDVSQYGHAGWKYQDGFTKGIIYDVAQTPDGYLWLATEFGLVRFDGVKPVPWEPALDPSKKAQALPSTNVRKIFVDRGGTLWISTLNGLASWKDGKLSQYPELSGFAVGRAIQDHEGSIWAAGRSATFGKLCEIRNNITKCSGESVLGLNPYALHEDSKGSLWVGTTDGVWRWKPGPPELYPVSGQQGTVQAIAEDADSALLIAWRGGVRRLEGAKSQMRYPLPAPFQGLDTTMLRDRDGGLWAGTTGGGIVHFHQGRTDLFSQSDGLTGDRVLSFFEDREGNVWAATTNGLDRFRELPVVTYTTRQGLSNAPSDAVLAARDGSIWAGTSNGLNRLDHAGVTVYSDHGGSSAKARVIRGSALPDHQAALFEDSQGRVWISSLSGIGYMENDRYISAASLPEGITYALTEDNNKDLWIANAQVALFRLSRGNEVRRIPWDTLGSQGPGRTLAGSPSEGGIWIGFVNGGVVWFRDGRVQASYSAANGLGHGTVTDLRFDRAGTLWIATEGGLSLLKNGKVSTFTKENGLPCDGVHWTLEDDSESVWLMTPCGLVRARLSDFEPRSGGRTIRSAVFDRSDGLSLRAMAGGLSPHAGKSSDGQLWFWNVDGLGMVDLRHLPFNQLPPPVHIEEIVADRKTYSGDARLRLPPLVRDLQIDYTALSMVAPERNQFKYKLEGYDRDWVYAGNRRQAFYTNLSPRNYHFRVQASNNNGVWNEAGDSLEFSIAPAWYQTTWFLASSAVGLVAILWGLYRLRLHQLARQFGIRIEERVGERTRIARDLHDTLLQSFQGLLLKFHAVTYLLGENPEARKRLESAIDQARAAITEGRDAVEGLRSSMVISNDLGEAIGVLGDGLAADQPAASRPEFRVDLEGAPRNLTPLIRDDVYRIAGEALRNAFHHSEAKRIEVEIRYDPRELRVRVRDDGKGIEPKFLDAQGRSGHYGLPGMHERAGMIGGRLAVWSELRSGTEVELTVPASIAYARSPQDRRSTLSGQGV
jgi:signal transduction histidine kinase/ligand-binding sensor domain-containing protein